MHTREAPPSPLPLRPLHRSIFMSTMEELQLDEKLHENDDLLSDYAARLEPGYWKFVCPDSKNTRKHGRKPNGNWEHQAVPTLHKYQDSGHPDVPAPPSSSRREKETSSLDRKHGRRGNPALSAKDAECGQEIPKLTKEKIARKSRLSVSD